MPVADVVNMTTSPVHVEIDSPVRFDRSVLAVRVVLAIVLGWLGITAGWVVCLLYLALPLTAAIATMLGRFRDLGSQLVRMLDWLLQVSAFMILLTDRLPSTQSSTLLLELPLSGQPTIGSALLRLLTSLPSGLVLLVLWFVSALLWIAGAITVLLGAAMPRSLLGYQRGVLRWQARLVAYHASLVDDYPPFALDTGAVDHSAFATSEAR